MSGGEQMIIRGDSIISFLEGKTEDYKGRTFTSMLEWTNDQLEYCHDQVQWMFPLHEESKHANTYPIVDKDVVEKTKNSLEVRNNLRLAKDRFERFYGFGPYEDRDIQRKWCKDHNHNLLRVTRILRCLRLFGLEDEAFDFYRKAYAVGQRLGISNITLDYWDKAMNDDVWESLQ